MFCKYLGIYLYIDRVQLNGLPHFQGEFKKKTVFDNKNTILFIESIL